MDNDEFGRLQALDTEIGSIEELVGDLFTHMKCTKIGEKNGNPVYGYMPTEEYDENPFSIVDCVKTLEGMMIDGDTEYHTILDGRRNSSIKKLEAIAARGNDSAVTQMCIEYYMNLVPSGKELEMAEHVLEEGHRPPEEDKRINAYVLKGRLEDTIRGKDLKHWKVGVVHPKPDEKISRISVHKHKKTVFIRDDYEGSEREAKKSDLHEIGVHVFQWENGLLQPLPQTFFYGLDGRSVKTYEGLSKIVEKRAGVLTDLNKSAAYVVAVDASLRGASYKDIIILLGEYDLPDSMVKDVAHRVKRGLRDTSKPGGFPKDAAYFSGMLQLEDYLAGGGSLDTIYVGCVSVEQAPIIDKLLEEGKLRPARYLPDI